MLKKNSLVMFIVNIRNEVLYKIKCEINFKCNSHLNVFKIIKEILLLIKYRVK